MGATPLDSFETSKMFFLQWMKTCMWFGWNPLFFLPFSALLFKSFWGMKWFQSVLTVGTVWVQLLLRFPTYWFETCQCFLYGMKMCIWFIILYFFLLFLLYERFFLKGYQSGYLMGATRLTIFHSLFWNFANVFCMEWRCACGWGIHM